MNVIPRQLSAIRRDWTRIRAEMSRLNLNQRTGRQVRLTLDRLMSLKTRLTRCRHVVTRPASRVRAQLLRSVFQKWRAFVKQALHSPVHRDGTVSYLHFLLRNTSALDPNSWPLRLAVFDSGLLSQSLPEMPLQAPPSAQINLRDPYWQAVKGNPSTARL